MQIYSHTSAYIYIHKAHRSQTQDPRNLQSEYPRWLIPIAKERTFWNSLTQNLTLASSVLHDESIHLNPETVTEIILMVQKGSLCSVPRVHQWHLAANPQYEVRSGR